MLLLSIIMIDLELRFMSPTSTRINLKYELCPFKLMLDRE